MCYFAPTPICLSIAENEKKKLQSLYDKAFKMTLRKDPLAPALIKQLSTDIYESLDAFFSTTSEHVSVV